MATEKETTAPIPSVAPDGEQPSALARMDSITAFGEPHKRFGKIQAMTMPELMETRFRVRPAVIDGLLPAGTYLLAGAPKIGKSFLVLQMAYQVSMGAPFLGFSSRQGTVLYLALEDTCERLQKRLAQMTEQDSEHLILSVFSETLDEGLTERLSDFWSEHTDTVLIVIDTLQRVRSRTPDNGSYAADYDTLARLKEFSDTYGVTVLVVHHTRKEGAEDVFNTISGTNGLMGAADGALILYKDKRTASDEQRKKPPEEEPPKLPHDEEHLRERGEEGVDHAAAQPEAERAAGIGPQPDPRPRAAHGGPQARRKAHRTSAPRGLREENGKLLGRPLG